MGLVLLILLLLLLLLLFLLLLHFFFKLYFLTVVVIHYFYESTDINLFEILNIHVNLACKLAQKDSEGRCRVYVGNPACTNTKALQDGGAI